MTWVRLDDGFAEHDKVLDLSHPSFRLHVVALCYCARNGTDGQLSRKQVPIVTAVVGLSGKRAQRNLDELVAAGMWEAHDDGSYELVNFLEYNPSAAEVEERRAERAARMKAARDLSHSPPRDIGGDNSGDTRPYPVPSRPVLNKSFDDFANEVGLTAKQRAEVASFPPELLMDAMNVTVQRGADKPAAYFMVLVRKGKVPTPSKPTLPCPKCGLDCKSATRRDEHLRNVHGVEAVDDERAA